MLQQIDHAEPFDWPFNARSGEASGPSSQTLPAPTIESLVAQLAAGRRKHEQQAAELAEQAAAIDRLRSDMESTATEAIGLKISDYKLRDTVSRQAKELDMLRAALAEAQASASDSAATGEVIAPSDGEVATPEPAPRLSHWWWWLIATLVVVAMLAALAVASMYRS